MWTCNSCDNEFSDKDYIFTAGNSRICRDCYDESYFTCDSCGNIYHNDDWCEGEYCEECSRGSESIHNSDYTPYPLIFNKLDKETTNEFFGFELETETDDLDLAEYVTDNLIYCKEDCSVNGFEMVTHPMTRKFFYNHIKNGGFDNMFNLKGKGCRSYNADGSCGLHIHMSKKSFSKLTLYKMFKLIYSPENNPFWNGISRRAKGRLNDYASINQCTSYMAQYARDSHGYGKFSGLNVTHTTVEIRIFRGTLDKDSFIGNVELYLAFKDYATQSSISNISIENFMKFVIGNSKTYKNLILLLDKVWKQKEYLSVGFVGDKSTAHVAIEVPVV